MTRSLPTFLAQDRVFCWKSFHDRGHFSAAGLVQLEGRDSAVTLRIVVTQSTAISVTQEPSPNSVTQTPSPTSCGLTTAHHPGATPGPRRHPLTHSYATAVLTHTPPDVRSSPSSAVRPRLCYPRGLQRLPYGWPELTLPPGLLTWTPNRFHSDAH